VIRGIPPIGLVVLLVSGLTCTAGAGLIVSDYEVSPVVLSPDGEGLVTVTVTNGGGAPSGANSSTGMDGDPFIASVRLHSTDLQVLSGSFDGIGRIGPGQQVRVTFHVRAPQARGIYSPEVRIRTEQGDSIRHPLVVNVGTQVGQLARPALVLERSQTDPVTPGSPFTVNLSLVNRGSATATDVILTVNSSSPSIALEGAGTHSISRLAPGAAFPLALVFSTDRQVQLGLRPIAVTLDYVLPDGTPARQNEVVSVMVRGRAELGLASLTTDPVHVARGEAFTLLARLENSGTDDANSVRAHVDLPFPGGNESFVGTIEPGNDAPVVFNLVADQAGVAQFTLTASWDDEEGTHTLSEPLTVEVCEGGTARFLVAAGFVVGGLLIGAWYWRRRAA